MMVSVLVHSGLAHDFVSLLLTMTLVKKQNKNSTVCDLSILTFMPSLSLITGLHLFTSSWGFLSGPEQSFGIPRGPAALAVSLKQVQARPPPTHPESRYSHFKHCYGAAAALMPRPTLTLWFNTSPADHTSTGASSCSAGASIHMQLRKHTLTETQALQSELSSTDLTLNSFKGDENNILHETNFHTTSCFDSPLVFISMQSNRDTCVLL